MIINTRIIYSILFYVLFMILIILAKPGIMFNKNGEIKGFGVLDNEKTLFSFGVFTVIIAIISFYIFVMIDLIFSKN